MASIKVKSLLAGVVGLVGVASGAILGNNKTRKKVEEAILEEMEKKNIKSKVQKIIISLQKIDGEDALVCTIFVSMLGMIRAKILVKGYKIEEFEKKNIFDFISVSKKKTD